ncbi:MAG: prepilin peptidase [Eubacteriales bacterium]|nr:prepilin peptidase [Eubacteriales bacterium]
MVTLLYVSLCGISDIRHAAIKNGLHLGYLVVMVFVNAMANDGSARSYLLRTLTALFIFFPLYRFRLAGGADVKMLALTGATFGPMPMLNILLYAAICGSLLGLSTVFLTRIRRGTSRWTERQFLPVDALRPSWTGRVRRGPIFDQPIPLAACLAVGTWQQMMAEGGGRWLI